MPEIMITTAILYVTMCSYMTAGCPAGCTCDVTLGRKISCAKTSLSQIPVIGDSNSDAEIIDFSDNSIQNLNFHDSAVLPKVKTATFHHNLISTISSRLMDSLPALEILDISYNRLTKLDGVDNIKSTSLLQLDLSNNNLTHVDGALDNLKSLQKLNLADNKLNSINASSFSNLLSLRYLILSNNRIRSIDRRSFRHLDKLTRVVFRGNPLKNLHTFHFHSPYLSYIDASECDLMQVPKGLPTSLRYLQLRRNNINRLHRDDFAYTTSLNILVLDDNKVVSIETGTFEQLQYLQQLWLNHNQLFYVPYPLPSSLQRLLIDFNSVQFLTNVFPANSSKLTTLSLSGNNISHLSFDALYHLRNLLQLDLSKNKITHIFGNTFQHQSKLIKLQLSKNPFDYLHSKSFHGLYSLREIELSHISTNTVLHEDIFEDLVSLNKLVFDSSKAIIESFLNSDRILLSFPVVEEISLRSSDLTYLRPIDFSSVFPRLRNLVITSSKWHCSMQLVWFKDWLISSSVPPEDQLDNKCLTPRSLYGKPLITLTNKEFSNETVDLHSDQMQQLWESLQSSTVIKVLSTPRTDTTTNIPDRLSMVELHFEDYDYPSYQSIIQPVAEANVNEHRHVEPSPHRKKEDSSTQLDRQKLIENSQRRHRYSSSHSTTISISHRRQSEPDNFILIMTISSVTATIIICVCIILIIFFFYRKSKNEKRSKQSKVIEQKHQNGVLYFAPDSGTASKVRWTDCL